MPVRKIIHVDMDAFYASVDSTNDRAPGSSRRGSTSLSPSRIACPRIFADYTQMIEPLALDEAYLDVTGAGRGLPTAAATAKEIHAGVHQETSLTATAGVSYNKFSPSSHRAHAEPERPVRHHAGHGPGLHRVAAGGVKFHGVGPVSKDAAAGSRLAPMLNGVPWLSTAATSASRPPGISASPTAKTMTVTPTGGVSPVAPRRPSRAISPRRRGSKRCRGDRPGRSRPGAAATTLRGP